MICLAKWVQWNRKESCSSRWGFTGIRPGRPTRHEALPWPQVVKFIQEFSCDVICMSPLNRSCGALLLSSICTSLFLPPRQQRLWAGRSWRRTPFLRSQKRLERFLKLFSWPLLRVQQKGFYVSQWLLMCLCICICVWVCSCVWLW